MNDVAEDHLSLWTYNLLAILFTLLERRKQFALGGILLSFFLQGGKVEHQRFQPGARKLCKWIAFLYFPYWDMLSSEMT